MYSIGNLFSLSYWFSTPDAALGVARIVWYGIPLLALILSVVLFVLSRRSSVDSVVKRLMLRAMRISAWFGVTLLLVTFARQHQIPFFSWRLWALVILGLTAWRAYEWYRYFTLRVPEIRSEQALRERREKYLRR